jgi:NAD(P)-dependent dehydrogenase (short-subunit alcohol dehydrogenase family)
MTRRKSREWIVVQDYHGLTGRTALVTGGGRGLGAYMTRALAGAGAKVLICGRDPAALERTASDVRAQTGGSVDCFEADLSDRAQLRDLAGAIGEIDIFVGNAGIERLTYVDTVTDEDVDVVFETNTTANILLSQAVVGPMKIKGWGRIIYVSSIVARLASQHGHGVYSASKGALETYARVAAVELGGSGITVNCIAPGTFLTDLAQTRLDSYGPEAGKAAYDAFAEAAALKRWGRPEELEGPLLLLAGERGSFITGQVLHVDGGQSIKMGV